MSKRSDITTRLSEMSVGERLVLPFESHDTARCSANYLKRTYGCVFTVRKCSDGIEVMLLADSEADLIVDEAFLRRNGFIGCGNGSMVYKGKNVSLSYNVKRHRLVFCCQRREGSRKESGTIELRYRSQLRQFLDLLDLKFYLK